jgi:hypothetical protein
MIDGEIAKSLTVSRFYLTYFCVCRIFVYDAVTHEEHRPFRGLSPISGAPLLSSYVRYSVARLPHKN